MTTKGKPSVRHRPSLSLGYLWYGKGRARMLEVCKNLGITDVCTCEDPNTFRKDPPWRMRKNSGRIGMRECSECYHLLWPLSYLYSCDECTEPFLSDQYPLLETDDCLCFDCALEF